MFIYILPLIFSGITSLLCLIPLKRFDENISIIGSLLSFIVSLWILFMPDVINNFLYIDGLSKIMLCTISIIYVTTVLFSTTYFKHIEKPLLKKNIYYLFLNLFVLSMLFSVSINNLGLIWIGIEATTITSALLVAIDNEITSIEAAWRYILIVSTGLIISLIGIVLIYASSNTLLISKLLIHDNNIHLLMLGASMIIVGFGTKAGIFPMHTWLIDVHGRSIAPVSAIFSSVLLPTALYGIMRVMFIAPFPAIKVFAFVLGFLSIAFASVFLVNQKYYKRMFAYSTMENMGMILIGISLGGYGFLGAVILLISHAFAKSASFFLTGNILSRYGTREIKNVLGLTERMPFTGYTLIFSSLAVTGAPPFATFLGELLIALQCLHIYGFYITLVLFGFITLAFISVNYKVAYMAFSEANGNIHERKLIGTTIPLINVLLSFLIMFSTFFIQHLLNSVVRF